MWMPTLNMTLAVCLAADVLSDTAHSVSEDNHEASDAVTA